MKIIIETIERKQCIMSEKILTISYTNNETRIYLGNNFGVVIGFGGEQLFYDIIQRIKKGTDIHIEERADEIYTITELENDFSLLKKNQAGVHTA